MPFGGGYPGPLTVVLTVAAGADGRASAGAASPATATVNAAATVPPANRNRLRRDPLNAFIDIPSLCFRFLPSIRVEDPRTGRPRQAASRGESVDRSSPARSSVTNGLVLTQATAHPHRPRLQSPTLRQDQLWLSGFRA